MNTKYVIALRFNSDTEVAGRCKVDNVFVKRNWSQNALENGSTLSQKFMTI